MTCAQLGLEPGPLGHAYLVPFKDHVRECKDRRNCSCRTEVQFIPGYRGLVELARRSGQVQSVQARVVYHGDEFVYAYGLNPRLDHTPSGKLDGVTHVYAVIRYKDGGVDFDVMTKAEVDAVRQRSKASTSGPWVTDYPEMAKKTVLKRLLKTAPMSVEYQQAVAQDEQTRARIDLDALDIAPPEPEPTVDGEVVGEQAWPDVAKPADAS